MTPFLSDPDFTLYVGDVRDVLPALPAESVDCALTSPPFYGLRDYGVDGQIGSEATPDEWVGTLVDVFRDVRRILKPEGTLWIECGDSYNSATSSSRVASTLEGSHGYWENAHLKRRLNVAGVKPKDLIGTPWLLALALRADGWWLRQAIIWHKPNAMPGSATDRCTTAHSYVFLLSRSLRYHFDADAIAEPASPNTHARYAVARETPKGREGHDGWDESTNGYVDEKNPRSVWTIPTQGYPAAHFATWPEALAERIILAGCPKGGTVLDPFMGSGTSAVVSKRLGRQSIGVELSAEYAGMAADRYAAWWKKPTRPPTPPEEQQSLLAEEVA